ncbi:MAG: fibronectin type III domain-containing protein [Candidatus Berkelbacteria bacterium Athens1014_28]|uniref:Fibronectin type III domain-containing protein n=1 Tax=Candidatus Berkelbacteria bacterium Athens1014_28 TaxID=2017145 RepID=A0A554LMT7_9BACT|nr:MAG: fibronectin type III domain-containing protein [Candidatus Berkelbacteria bacterium Athens1014_28]
MKEKIRKFILKHRKLVLIVSAVFIFLLVTSLVVFAKINHAVAPKPVEEKVEETTPAPVPEAPKEEIAKQPPKRASSGKTSTKTNSDGSKTVTTSTGPVDSAAQSAAAAAGPSGSTPLAINYLDQTGAHGSLGDVLKNYLNSSLKWDGEVPALYAIILENAGASGWAGLYSGQYTQSAGGQITSAWGYITLNSYYYEGNPYFNDYMKLILSHEYGHHYTLYHKWLAWQSPYNARFPDSYYSVRPLTKATTAADYSLGWGNCDAEIIAEDYSYLYSGYGYHAMSGTYGYPSAGTRTWIVNEPSGPSAPPPADNPPTVSISAPANGATVSGTTAFSANASDDVGVTKVDFYIGTTLLSEDSSSPYSYNLNTTSYGNGAYTLKATATDSSSQTTSATISVTINNATSDTENPTIVINNPEGNPYAWTSGNLYIRSTATDNVAVTKIELYINDYLVATENAALIERIWPWDNVGPGAYTLKAKSYDSSGNTAETSIVINKS